MDLTTPFGLFWFVLFAVILAAVAIELRGALACLIDRVVEAWRHGARHHRDKRDR